ncbi:MULTISPECIES: ATP-binding cassette domain-containing protein [unclassified Bradyrhizobium]|uniref:ATP-binding cassette domain-containing protein n=1 Tax=unclassified Bradyrhizobium TaxID=2631580 RepID=UPI002303F7DB|nr:MULTISPECIES: ATP-binding cassette domain-containing protein [unclassified Bradyrhizobium]
MVEALMGQRDRSGKMTVSGSPFNGTRQEIARLGVYGLPQEPLKNACIDRMSLAENLALRNFDRVPLCRGIAMNYGALAEQAERLVAQFRVKAPGLNASMSALSGGNVQRAVLARELTQDVRLLVASNPTFGLDSQRAKKRTAGSSRHGTAEPQCCSSRRIWTSCLAWSTGSSS